VQTRSSHDLPLLDGLRAVAALLVVTTHVGFQTGATRTGAGGALVARFDLGVALFFALSGFLLVRPWLAEPRTSTRRYALRRAARILPAYWVVLVAALLTTDRGASAASIVRHLLLLQTYRAPLLSGLTQTWSLCTEVAFYVLLPLVAPLISVSARTLTGRRRLVVALGGACVVAWIWTGLAAASHLPTTASTWLPGHLDWFAVGIALAVVERQARLTPTGAAARARDEIAAHPGSVLLLAGAVVWLAGTPLAGPRTLAAVAPGTAIFKEALYACLAALLVAAVGAVDQRSGPVHAVLGHPAMQHLGRVSYGVFLWHLLVLTAVLNVLGKDPFTGGFWPVLLLTVAGTVAVASVSWTLLEGPVLRRVHRPRDAPRALTSR
jgi:peptidoglycan/LPS O-acetylase OafA/YrhL